MMNIMPLISKISQCDIADFETTFRKNPDALFQQYRGNIPTGTYFLCDCDCNTLQLCKATKRKYKNGDGRLVDCKVVFTFVKNCSKKWGAPVNGCWIIPSDLMN